MSEPNEKNEVRFEPQEKQAQALQSAADIVIFGGAAGGGKTWTLLYEPTYFISNSRFGAVLFRRTYPQITQEGGLWEESEELYPYAGAVASKGRMQWTFPSGATVSFRAMEHEDDRYVYDGAQIAFIGFDQLESFTKKQFFYMLSRNRSTSGVRPVIRASANPRPGWLAEFLQWWWDPKTGYAIPERSGKVRWFVRVADSLRWFGSKAEALKAHPGVPPKSVTFIFSKLTDNKVLMEKDPGYMANLMALPLVDRERLLGGNWKIVVAGNIFKPEWWKYVDVVPADATITGDVRFWDKAATAAEEGGDPDWTAGVRILRDTRNNIYILHVKRFQASPYQNEVQIAAQSRLDGPTVRQCMEQEGGASGKSDIAHYGRDVLPHSTFTGVPSRKNKVLRWGPLSSAAEHGRAFLVRGDWNQAFVDELAGCKGEDEKNDQADAASGAYDQLFTPTGAWAAADVAAASTGHEPPKGEALDPMLVELELNETDFDS